MTELRNCPFCGGKAIFKTHSITDNEYGDTRILFEIKCSECNMSSTHIKHIDIRLSENGEVETYQDEREKAIEAWNKRV